MGPKQSSKTRAAARQDESSCSMRNAFASTVVFSCVMCSFLSSSSRCVFIIYIKKVVMIWFWVVDGYGWVWMDCLSWNGGTLHYGTFTLSKSFYFLFWTLELIGY